MCQIGSVTEFIVVFDQLVIHSEGLTYAFYIECFINGLKEVIIAHVRMQHPATWLEACDQALQVEVLLNTQPTRPSFTPCAQPIRNKVPPQHLKVQQLHMQ